jgi:hypothetical protein
MALCPDVLSMGPDWADFTPVPAVGSREVGVLDAAGRRRQWDAKVRRQLDGVKDRSAAGAATLLLSCGLLMIGVSMPSHRRLSYIRYMTHSSLA